MIAVYIISFDSKHKEIVGKLVYDGNSSKVQWEYCNEPGFKTIINEPVTLKGGVRYYSDKHPKEWIENLWHVINNGYMMATKPEEE